MSLDVDLDATQAMDAAATQLSQLSRDHGIDALSVVTAGIPGPVDRHTGLVRSPTILSGWVGLQDPAAELQRGSARIQSDRCRPRRLRRTAPGRWAGLPRLPVGSKPHGVGQGSC